MHGVNWILTVCDLSGNELQGFVEKYHWNGELHNGNPFFTRQRGHLEYGLKQNNGVSLYFLNDSLDILIQIFMFHVLLKE